MTDDDCIKPVSLAKIAQTLPLFVKSLESLLYDHKWFHLEHHRYRDEPFTVGCRVYLHHPKTECLLFLDGIDVPLSAPRKSSQRQWQSDVFTAQMWLPFLESLGLSESVKWGYDSYDGKAHPAFEVKDFIHAETLAVRLIRSYSPFKEGISYFSRFVLDGQVPKMNFKSYGRAVLGFPFVESLNK